MLQQTEFTHQRTEENIQDILKTLSKIGMDSSENKKKELQDENFSGYYTRTHYSHIVSLFDGEIEIGLVTNGNQAADLSALVYTAEIDGYINQKRLVTKDEEKWKKFIKKNWWNQLPEEAKKMVHEKDRESFGA